LFNLGPRKQPKFDYSRFKVDGELVAPLPAPMGAGGDGRSVDHGENDDGHDDAVVLCLFDAEVFCCRTEKWRQKGMCDDLPVDRGTTAG
jgi:hypothetical protein